MASLFAPLNHERNHFLDWEEASLQSIYYLCCICSASQGTVASFAQWMKHFFSHFFPAGLPLTALRFQSLLPAAAATGQFGWVRLLFSLQIFILLSEKMMCARVFSLTFRLLSSSFLFSFILLMIVSFEFALAHQKVILYTHSIVLSFLWDYSFF